MNQKRRRGRNQNTDVALERPATTKEVPAVHAGRDPVHEDLVRSRKLRHQLWIHQDVQEILQPHGNLYTRLGLVIEQLGARGRTSIVKTCQGDNRGWYRTPLGGGSGSHYYLWWTTAGSRQGLKAGLPAGGIAIRSARHHDDHRTLEPLGTADYKAVANAAAIDGTVAGDPWTDAQVQFRNGAEPVRVLEGHPGSGKTTALWHSVDARKDEHVLYITWSAALAEDADRHFSSFAAPGVRTSCIDYASLLGRLTNKETVRIPLRESRTRLTARVEKIEGGQTNPWIREPIALHAELRGVLLGGATGLDERGTTIQDGCLRLTDDGYKKHRRQIRRIKEQSMDALLGAAQKLPGGTLADAFPELAAAREALESLRGNSAPPTWIRNVDRIVVDEAQDLTLTETAVITELCRRIGEPSGLQPKLLMAGDEGQTVRPTAFNWRRTRELLHRRVGKPKTYVLDGQVRCPERIAEAAAITNRYYRELEKNNRPGGQHDMGPAPTDGGRVLQVTGTGSELENLVRKLTEEAQISVISATALVPDWVPDELRDHILTPAEAKGLEYQTVCIINLFQGCCTAVTTTLGSKDSTLSQELRRTAIDQVRVAMTRSTDTLVILERQDQYHIAELSKVATRCATQDLVADVTDDSPPLERALALSEECRQLRDENVGRALLRGRQALRLLLEEKGFGGEADEGLQNNMANAVLGTVAAHLLLNGTVESEQDAATQTGLTALEVKHSAERDEGAAVEAERGTEIEEELLTGIANWQKGSLEGAITAGDRFMLLQERERTYAQSETTYGGWADATIRMVRERLAQDIEKGAATRAGWECLQPNVVAWFEALGVEEPEKRATRTAEAAFDALLAAGAARNKDSEAATLLNRAEAILATLEDDPRRTARIEELEDRPLEALRLYTRAGADADAKRVVTENGLWEHAEELSEAARSDAMWLLEFETVVNRQPKGLGTRLTAGDRRRLTERSGSASEQLVRTRR